MIVGGDYVPCENLSKDPKNGFEIDIRMVIAVADDLDCIVHSHGDGPPFPTAEDMESQSEMEVPWAIISTYKGNEGVGCTEPVLFGDSLPIPPLLKRPFRHGVTDCYSLIRDFYRLEMGILIPDFPRTWGWWIDKKDKKTGEIIEHALDLYTDHFKTAGFRELRVGEEPKYGDVFFANILSKKLNHGGVYVEHGRIMHHPIDSMRKGYAPQSLSREDSATRWMNCELFRGWVRYGD